MRINCSVGPKFGEGDFLAMLREYHSPNVAASDLPVIPDPALDGEGYVLIDPPPPDGIYHLYLMSTDDPARPIAAPDVLAVVGGIVSLGEAPAFPTTLTGTVTLAPLPPPEPTP